MFVLLSLAAAVYSPEDSCEGKAVCLQKDLPESQQKIEELYNLNIGGTGYRDIVDRSADISIGLQALYEAGRTAKELALLRAQYEGIGKAELIIEQRITTSTTTEDAPDFTEEDIPEIDFSEVLKREKKELAESQIESANIRLNDGSLFSRDYFVRFKNGKWEWCKNPVFGSCDDKKFNSIHFPKKEEAGEFYEILYSLETANIEGGSFSREGVPLPETAIYERGLVDILRKLVFLRLGISEMIFEIGNSRVYVEADTTRVVERFDIIISNRKAFVSGADDVRKFITTTEPFRPQFENIFQEFKNLVDRKSAQSSPFEAQPGGIPEEELEMEERFIEEGEEDRKSNNILDGFNLEGAQVIKYRFNEGPNKTRKLSDVDRVVLHHTEGSAPGQRTVDYLIDRRGLSIHYVVDKDGNIIYAMSEDMVAFHAGCKRDKEIFCVEGMNERSIGIEITNSGRSDDLFTDAQYNTLRQLLPYITNNLGIPFDNEHIIAHYEITSNKDDPQYFLWDKIGLSSHISYNEFKREHYA